MNAEISNNIFLNEMYERLNTKEDEPETFKHFNTAVDLLGFIDTLETPELLTIVVLCKDTVDLQKQKKIFFDVAIQYYGQTVPFAVVAGNKVEFLNGLNLAFDLEKWQYKKSYKVDEVVFVFVNKDTK